MATIPPQETVACAQSALAAAQAKVATLQSINPYLIDLSLRENAFGWRVQPASTFPPDVLEMMIRLTRRDLRAGTRLVCDEPDQLMNLHSRIGNRQRFDVGATCPKK
jgi:hypothetical protein